MLPTYGVQMPGELSAAITTTVMALTSYMTPSSARDLVAA
jgi:hypothetical protein